METAPHDRPILIKLAKMFDKPCIVAKYAQWDENGLYKEMWETGCGQGFRVDNKCNYLVGWMDLPKDMLA